MFLKGYQFLGLLAAFQCKKLKKNYLENLHYHHITKLLLVLNILTKLNNQIKTLKASQIVVVVAAISNKAQTKTTDKKS